MPSEHDMLVRRNMLRSHQDIGHNSTLPFCRQEALLGGFVQGNELVVGWSWVSIRGLELIIAT